MTGGKVAWTVVCRFAKLVGILIFLQVQEVFGGGMYFKCAVEVVFCILTHYFVDFQPRLLCLIIFY